ncbi:putative pyridoxamine 5'-phosphate oxidase domain-containing protein [Chloropicon primus]|uniref:Pyridoxamine 5'-phosphate oxidase N-terminal domain-containing protein n=1 Tax=Chloropicon primus TaxID=1764295 RepID=A0A5B8MJP0_9CHLO|nr:hypothetical protein A3770_04p32010 [Chloropicon primus]UPQ99895.1 putative pyridoxamine 5'-phosphate oxidase domain-containing protein [Chloropicon primus]|eukprot:QDZ20683.1 hypothetical protein A3770_04p32010 [Chloropicon primus]
MSSPSMHSQVLISRTQSKLQVPPELQELVPDALGSSFEISSLSSQALGLPREQLQSFISNFKNELMFMLDNCPLSYLATADTHGETELSLMFFTFDESAQAVVFSTPKDTKWRNMLENERVSLLLHNFEGKAATQSLFQGVKPQSITLYGRAEIMEKGKAAEAGRRQHDEGHGKYGKAFQGSDKVIARVHVDRVLVVDVKGNSMRLVRKA